MSVNTKMTAIADKIRGLLGLTGTMGLDAMATHLGTEQANITAALTALSDKGVDVPSGANSDNLAELIAAIEAGGGKIIYGSTTPAADGPAVVIPYSAFSGEGSVPRIAVVWPDATNRISLASNTTYYYGIGVIYFTDTDLSLPTGTSRSYAAIAAQDSVQGKSTALLPFVPTTKQIVNVLSGIRVNTYGSATNHAISGRKFNYLMIWGDVT